MIIVVNINDINIKEKLVDNSLINIINASFNKEENNRNEKDINNKNFIENMIINNNL